MPTLTNMPNDEFYDALGRITDLSAKVESLAATVLAVLISEGNAVLGLQVTAGESLEWVLSKLKRFGKRLPNQLPGLDEWCDRCRTVAARRNRATHDRHEIEMSSGKMTAYQFAKHGDAHLKSRATSVRELTRTVDDLQRVYDELASLMPMVFAAIGKVGPALLKG